MKLIGVGEAAEVLGIRPMTVRKHLRNGVLGGYKVGGAIRLDEVELRAWLAARRMPSPSVVESHQAAQ